MSVKHQHKDYTAMLDKWNRCIDVCKGQDAIHAAGEMYLPKLADQSKTEYDAYKGRTPFYNATWRTISGLQGMLFRKPPQVKVPTLVEKLTEDISMSGESLHMLSLEVAEEALKLGRVGLFVDFPVVPEGATQADAIVRNLRPSMRLYTAKSIINWKTEVVKNRTVISMVVLKETIDEKVDEFETKEKIQYRVLDLFDTNLPDGSVVKAYRVRVIEVREINGKEEDKTLSTSFPKINSKLMEEIPFYFIGVDDNSWEIDEPPLIDLVDMNLSHYRTTADYEHGCHFTGLPTPVISGYTPEKEGEKFYIGSMTAWVFPRPDAKATYLEFTGQGLKALQENLSKKETYMAVLGARMLEPQVKKTESANTAAINRGGEQSMLASVAQSISIGIEAALKTFCKFAGSNEVESVSFELNRDFFPAPIDSLMLTAIIAGWQNGAYSYETMFDNLKKGEVVPVERTADQELEAIKKNPPPMQEVGTTPGNRGDASPKAPKMADSPATLDPTITQLQNKGGTA